MLCRKHFKSKEEGEDEAMRAFIITLVQILRQIMRTGMLKCGRRGIAALLRKLLL